MSVKLVMVALLAAAATVATAAPEQGAPPKELHVVTGCGEASCKDAGCQIKKYPSGTCVQGEDKVYKADCSGATPALKKFDDMDKCEKDANEGQTETLPGTSCAQDSASNKYQEATCVEATPAAAPMKLKVQKDCPDAQCAESACAIKTYMASGECIAVEGDAEKFYKATCGETKTLKIFDSEAACKSGQVETLPKDDTCTADGSGGKYHKATCVADDEHDNQPQPELTVLKQCPSNNCEASECQSKKYSLNSCVEKNSKFYKAACDPQGATLKEYTTKADCENKDNAGTSVTLPTAECASDNNNKFEKVVCPKGPGGDDNTPVGPFLLVNTSCGDDCSECTKTMSYVADGKCHEEMAQPPAGPGSKKYYIAECDTLTVTPYSDDKCKTAGTAVKYTETCDKTNKRIASCEKIPTSATTGTTSTTTGTTSSTTASGAAGTGDNNTTNNTNDTDSLSVSPVHSMGALALALAMMALMC